MKSGLPAHGRIIVVLLFIGALCGRAANLLPQLPPNQIIKKVMERSMSQSTNALRSNYSYTKHVLIQELDSSDKVKETKEKVFLVQGGVGHLQTMRINGKPVSEREMQKQQQQAIEARQKLTGSKSGKSDENWGQFLNTDLTARYRFNYLRQELYNNRPAYVLSFSPLPGKLPVHRLIDRALNQMTGIVWIDGQDFEIAKADLNLQSKVALGGILEILGALKAFHYSVERVRVAQFLWLNRRTKGEYEGRKLWETTHLRTETESTGFHKMAVAQAASP